MKGITASLVNACLSLDLGQSRAGDNSKFTAFQKMGLCARLCLTIPDADMTCVIINAWGAGRPGLRTQVRNGRAPVPGLLSDVPPLWCGFSPHLGLAFQTAVWFSLLEGCGGRMWSPKFCAHHPRLGEGSWESR